MEITFAFRKLARFFGASVDNNWNIEHFFLIEPLIVAPTYFQYPLIIEFSFNLYQNIQESPIICEWVVIWKNSIGYLRILKILWIIRLRGNFF